jgi:hypothetical protein
MGWEVCGELAINECSETEVECSLLDADACGGVDGCQTISGRELVDDGQGGQCFSFESQEVEVGCMGEDIDCGDAITFAASPDDPENCHMFNNTCIPSGWTACEASFEVCP